MLILNMILHFKSIYNFSFVVPLNKNLNKLKTFTNEKHDNLIKKLWEISFNNYR